MSLFRKDFNLEIKKYIQDLKKGNIVLFSKNSFILSEYRPTLEHLEEIDIQIIKDIKELHKLGKDIPELTTKLILHCSELHALIEKIKKNQELNLDNKTKIAELIMEIENIYLQEAKRFTSIILEENNHKIQTTKNEIINILNQIENSNNNYGEFEIIQSKLYNLLTERSYFKNLIGNKSRVEIMKLNEYSKYKNVIEQMMKYIDSTKIFLYSEDPDWFHVLLDSKKRYKELPSLKLYYTVSHSSLTNFIIYFIKLCKKIKEIQDRTLDSIEIKIPSRYDLFLSHPDTIVIHFKLKDNYTEINKTVIMWMKEYSISNEIREYSKPTLARDSSTTSFSNQIAFAAMKLMKQSYGKISNENLTILGINYLFRMAKKGF